MFVRIISYLQQVVGMAITLLIISMGLAFFAVSKIFFGEVEDTSIQRNRAIVETQYTAYDSNFVSGSALNTAMRRYSNKQLFYIYVKSSSGATFVANPTKGDNTCRQVDFNTSTVTNTMGSCAVTAAQMEDESSPYYIPPQARFKVTLARDSNDLVVGLLFAQQNT